MDKITQARHKFVLAFQYCSNGEEFPVFRKISVCEDERIHTGYCAIDLLDEALELNPDFQEARQLRGDIWHAILEKTRDDNSPRCDENYPMYLNSKAWSEIREKCFDHFGRQCLFCSNPATDVHHRDYANIGKENFLTDLSALCADCHQRFHEPRNPEPRNPSPGRGYWDQFKTYVEEHGNQLQLFPEPDLPSVYGIQIHKKTRKSADIRKEGAIWLVAYRDASKLQANLCLQSRAHYNALKAQGEINGEFHEDLGELEWDGMGQYKAIGYKAIGFSNDTVGHVSTANRDEEFSWLHDRLIRLQEVFRSRISEL